MQQVNVSWRWLQDAARGMFAGFDDFRASYSPERSRYVVGITAPDGREMTFGFDPGESPIRPVGGVLLDGLAVSVACWIDGCTNARQARALCG